MTKSEGRDQSGKSSDFASVGRAVGILEALAGERQGLRVTDLAAMMNLSRPTVFRILASLKGRGYVKQDEMTSLYSLTFHIVTLGHRFLAVHQFNDMCMPVLQRVAKGTGELVRLAATDGNELRWIAQVEGNLSRVRLYADLREPVPLHASATGKAWLSTLPEDEALDLALAKGLAARTAHTITTPDELVRELRRSRDRGYALALEEGDMGVRAVAVPIHHPEAGGQAPAVGAISVAGIAFNLDEQRLHAIAPLLQEAAEDLAPFWLGFSRAHLQSGRATGTPPG